jgi:hypothetical protein
VLGTYSFLLVYLGSITLRKLFVSKGDPKDLVVPLSCNFFDPPPPPLSKEHFREIKALDMILHFIFFKKPFKKNKTFLSKYSFGPIFLTCFVSFYFIHKRVLMY